jgi:iron-sulfur cluster insertion protein
MIKITDAAKMRLIDILYDEGLDIVRFGLQGGGCNGFQYYLSVEKGKEEDDTIYPLSEEKMLIVDPMSMMYLENAEIDFKRDIMGENFVFNNPNISNSCGCGSSVSF